jgi:hypothetical protein
MTIDEMLGKLSTAEREAFAERFLRGFLGAGFGSMSKRETEILVFHCLERTQFFGGLSFYERANVLRVLESKVKSLRADATQRYSQLSHKEAVRELATGIVREGRIGASFENDQIVLVIEDPSLRRELEHALRTHGGRVDYTLNRDVVAVKVPALLELLKRTLAFGDDDLAALLAADVTDAKAASRLLDSKLPLSDRVSAYLAERKGIVSAIGSLFSGLAKFFTTGTP